MKKNLLIFLLITLNACTTTKSAYKSTATEVIGGVNIKVYTSPVIQQKRNAVAKAISFTPFVAGAYWGATKGAEIETKNDKGEMEKWGKTTGITAGVLLAIPVNLIFRRFPKNKTITLDETNVHRWINNLKGGSTLANNYYHRYTGGNISFIPKSSSLEFVANTTQEMDFYKQVYGSYNAQNFVDRTLKMHYYDVSKLEYLANLYGGETQINAVNDRIKQIKEEAQEASEFVDAHKKNTVRDWESFLRKYPNGKKATEAKQKLQESKGTASYLMSFEWEKIPKENRSEIIENFIKVNKASAPILCAAAAAGYVLPQDYLLDYIKNCSIAHIKNEILASPDGKSWLKKSNHSASTIFIPHFNDPNSGIYFDEDKKKAADVYKSPYFYIGSFKNEKKSGIGSFYSEDCQLVGSFSNDDITSGTLSGILNYSVKSASLLNWSVKGTYSGAFKNHLAHGTGKVIADGGEIYEGDFKNGKYHGRGIYVIPTKNITYNGEFADGSFDGNGTFTSGIERKISSNGTNSIYLLPKTTNGTFKSGKPNGSFTLRTFLQEKTLAGWLNLEKKEVTHRGYAYSWEDFTELEKELENQILGKRDNIKENWAERNREYDRKQEAKPKTDSPISKKETQNSKETINSYQTCIVYQRSRNTSEDKFRVYIEYTVLDDEGIKKKIDFSLEKGGSDDGKYLLNRGMPMRIYRDTELESIEFKMKEPRIHCKTFEILND